MDLHQNQQYFNYNNYQGEPQQNLYCHENPIYNDPYLNDSHNGYIRTNPTTPTHVLRPTRNFGDMRINYQVDQTPTYTPDYFTPMYNPSLDNTHLESRHIRPATPVPILMERSVQTITATKLFSEIAVQTGEAASYTEATQTYNDTKSIGTQTSAIMNNIEKKILNRKKSRKSDVYSHKSEQQLTKRMKKKNGKLIEIAIHKTLIEQKPYINVAHELGIPRSTLLTRLNKLAKGIGYKSHLVFKRLQPQCKKLTPMRRSPRKCTSSVE